MKNNPLKAREMWANMTGHVAVFTSTVMSGSVNGYCRFTYPIDMCKASHVCYNLISLVHRTVDGREVPARQAMASTSWSWHMFHWLGTARKMEAGSGNGKIVDSIIRWLLHNLRRGFHSIYLPLFHDFKLSDCSEIIFGSIKTTHSVPTVW